MNQVIMESVVIPLILRKMGPTCMALLTKVFSLYTLDIVWIFFKLHNTLEFLISVLQSAINLEYCCKSHSFYFMFNCVPKAYKETLKTLWFSQNATQIVFINYWIVLLLDRSQTSSNPQYPPRAPVPPEPLLQIPSEQPDRNQPLTVGQVGGNQDTPTLLTSSNNNQSPASNSSGPTLGNFTIGLLALGKALMGGFNDMSPNNQTKNVTTPQRGNII